MYIYKKQKRMKKYVLFFISVLFTTLSDAQVISLTPYASGFNNPIDIEYAPGDSRMYVVQQRGRIRIVNSNGTIAPTDFLNISSLVSASGSERGLLGLAFHPDYVNNGYFFVNYTRASDGATRVSLFRRDSGNPDIADPTSEVVLLETAQPFSNHNGGCLKFGHDGYLYIGMGDGGDAGDPGNRSQNPLLLLGKMLRVGVDLGAIEIPSSNPYFGQTDTMPYIWSMGLRNPWRFSFDRLTGDMWIGDVGQGAWEEVNFQPASSTGGENYGWRCYEGNVAFNTSGCQPQSYYDGPVAVYSHGGGNCSVTGGYVYRGAEEGDLYGKYLYVDYCSGDFRLTYPNGSGGWITNALNSPNNFFVTFGENHDGELFIADINNGIVYRISTTVCQPTAAVWANGQTGLCGGDSIELSTPQGPGFTYQWQFNGSDIPGATGSTYYAGATGDYLVVVTDSNGCIGTAQPYTIGTLSVSVQADTSVCLNSGLVSFTGSPGGGTFSGPGISNNVFDPAAAGAGSHTIVYLYEEHPGCSATDSMVVSVLTPSPVSITGLPSEYCLDDPSFTLTGNPAGGNFSGPGMTGSTFDPLSAGTGMHSIVYTYTDMTGCDNSDTAIVTISDCDLGVDGNSSISQWNIYPNPATSQVNMNITIVEAKDILIRLISADGKVLLQFNRSLSPGENIIQMQLDGVAQGMYQLQLVAEKTWVRPLVIIK